ncbi:MAG TPA: hypothetical protein VGP63_30925 [Planctomycetaceae bacterium]|nr:hypothetical protein [Planctomycetaceae bacterium]
MRWFVVIPTVGAFLVATMAATCIRGGCPYCSKRCDCTRTPSPPGATTLGVTTCRLDCSLSPAARAERIKLFDKQLRPRLRTVRELSDGYSLGFASDDSVIMDLASWIRDERKCCRFLDYRLRVERNSDVVWFEATGDPQAKTVLADMLKKCGVKLKP